MKTSILIISVLLLSSLFLHKNNPFLITSTYTYCELSDDGYTKQRVNIDGVWWIFVYDSDGLLVNKYVDTNQDS